MPPKITFNKSGSSQDTKLPDCSNNKLQEMENALRNFFQILAQTSDRFNAEYAFDGLFNYIKEYDRILYSTISNIIYADYENPGIFEPAGTLLSNLDALISYAESDDIISMKKKNDSDHQTEKVVYDTQKAILKIWDHVTLASQQYQILKQSDEEYDEKFKRRIAGYKEEMSKEMNSQMITMVGIFTALAFLIFGSISSLDGIFENIQIPLFKTMSISLIWGLCVLNTIFIFLYCIGKMSKLNFKANMHPNASIFQRYPVIWWTNLMLILLLLITSWGYFIQQNKIGEWLIRISNNNPCLIFAIGSIIILSIIVAGVLLLAKKTKWARSIE